MYNILLKVLFKIALHAFNYTGFGKNLKTPLKNFSRFRWRLEKFRRVHELINFADSSRNSLLF